MSEHIASKLGCPSIGGAVPALRFRQQNDTSIRAVSDEVDSGVLRLHELVPLLYYSRLVGSGDTGVVMLGERVVARAFVVWLVLIAAEIVHGILRGLFLVPRVGAFRARQIGVCVASLLILAVACLFVRWIGAAGTKALLGVGFLWLVLFACFEVGFGHYVFGFSWEYLRADYDIPRGGLMPFGFVVLLLSPWIAARVTG